MPRYFLHIETAGKTISDDEGIDCPNFASALEEAVRGARGIMCGDIEAGFLDFDQAIEIRDESGTVLKRVTFLETVEVRMPAGGGEAVAGENNPDQ